MMILEKLPLVQMVHFRKLVVQFCRSTTVSARVTKELFDIGNNMEFDFIDAPISGGQAGAENGLLSIMCGGSKEAFNRANQLEIYSKICRNWREWAGKRQNV